MLSFTVASKTRSSLPMKSHIGLQEGFEETYRWFANQKSTRN
jgi:hypothetical protein